MPSAQAALRSTEVETIEESDMRAIEIAHVDVFEDFAAAAPIWERLTREAAATTPFSRREWVEHWYQHVGAANGLTPLIVVVNDRRGEPLCLLPLACRRGRFFTVARYFGGRHSQLNMGLWRLDAAAMMTAEDLNAVFATVAERHGIDLFVLLNQPPSWDGRRNPLAQLAHQPSPDEVFSIDFNGETGEQVIKTRLKSALRGLLKSKENKLKQLAGYRYFRAANADEADRLLAAFFVQKAAHMRAQGVANAFSEQGMDECLRAACTQGLESGNPAIELHALEGGGEVLAVMGGIASPRRFSSMFNSYTLTEHARWSPGLILISHLVRHCADRGIASYDLGAGYAPYKRFFCRTAEPLFDSFLSFSERGHVAAVACRGAFTLKRWIKSTGPLWAVARLARRMHAKLSRDA